jgi:O-succinylbenzoic acid--CoA ligase
VNAAPDANFPTVPWLDARARQTPDALALTDGVRSWTYAELAREVGGLSARLAGAVGPDGRVALLGANSAAYVLWLAAAQELGIETVPLNVRLAAPELGAQLADCAPDLLLCDRAHAERGRQAAAGSQVRLATFDEARAWDALDAAVLAARKPTRYEPDRVTTVMYTSGSTGTPKGVLQTYANHACSARQCQDNLGFTVSDVWGCPTPLFHMSGLSIVMRSLACGVGVRLYGRFDARAVNDDLLSGAVTCLSAVSYQIERLLDDLAERGGATYPPSLRFVLQGGGPLSLETLRRCGQANMPVVQSFGMTETASQVVALSPANAPLKPGSSGRPLGAVQLRVAALGGPGDEPVPAGETGRILLKGPTVATGYLNQPDRYAASFTEHGWFDTGDLGFVDADGFLYVQCRLTDLIVSGGENVYPAEVEAALASHPALRGVAVVGLPDPVWGAVAAAACVCEPHLPRPTLAELREHCRGRIAGYKCPRALAWVDELPRTAAGKLRRAAVQERLAAATDERV